MAAPGPAAGAAAGAVAPQDSAVILHFDVDCMYAQAEEIRQPHLAGKPLGVTQKYLIVTCNYPARAAGVTKLMSITEGLKRCPGLVLVPGEDLTPYRAASKAIAAVLQRFGPAQRLGMDEVFVDVTQEVEERMRPWGGRAPPGASWRGHVHAGSAPLVADSKHRPQDLRAPPGAPRGGAPAAGLTGPGQQQQQQQQQQEQRAGHPGDASDDGGEWGREDEAWLAAYEHTQQQEQQHQDQQQQPQQHGEQHQQQTEQRQRGGEHEPAWAARLMVGSVIAEEARAAVKAETGFRSSAGIACNKLLAKLVSGVHKPDDQTVLPPTEAWSFLEPLPVRALPGIGYKLAQQLAALGVATVADLRAQPLQRLRSALGDAQGAVAHALCRGLDSSPVTPSGAPKSITVEDSFAGCASWDAVRAVLQVLAPDLLSRIHEEWHERRRRPHTLTVRWRKKGAGWARSSASCPMPLPGPLAAPPGAREAEALVRAALQLLRQQLPGGFDLSLINLGASNLKEEGPGAGNFDTSAFSRLLGGGGGGVAGARGAPGAPGGAHRAAAGGRAPSDAAAGPAAGGAPGGGGGAARLPAWAAQLQAPTAGGWPADMTEGQAAPQLTQPGALVQQPAATELAAAAAARRRDYRRSPGGGGAAAGAALSKSEERRLREQGAGRAVPPPQQQAQPPQQRRQQQQHQEQQQEAQPPFTSRPPGVGTSGPPPPKLMREATWGASIPLQQEAGAAAAARERPGSSGRSGGGGSGGSGGGVGGGGSPSGGGGGAPAGGGGGGSAFDLLTLGGEVVGSVQVVSCDDDWPDDDAEPPGGADGCALGGDDLGLALLGEVCPTP